MPGQIVLCFRDEALVAHRLVRKSGSQFITRGDSLYNFDRPFQEDEILGRVVTIVRDGRQVDLNRLGGMARRVLSCGGRSWWCVCCCDGRGW